MGALPIVVALLGSLTPIVAVGTPLDESEFRYQRHVQRTGTGPAIVEPDGRMFAHAQPGFADLRILTAAGRQVAWRPLPEPSAAGERRLVLLYRGTRHGRAVALFDAGASRRRIDRIRLDIPARDFVARAEVLAGDDRRAFTKLSSTVVYDITGAASARSTTVVFPPAAARYYLVRVPGVPSVTGAAAVQARSPRARASLQRAFEGVTIAQRPRKTVITLDLGFRRIPVDRLRLTSTTPVYDRAVEVRESNDGRAWRWAWNGRVFRLPDSVAQDVSAATASRFVRLVVDTGDAQPLEAIRVSALADSRAILLRGGDRGPLRMLYGNPRIGAPEYDFALLPEAALELEAARPAVLGVERRNPASIPPPDVRSVFERWDWLVPALLGLAALAIGAAGVVAAMKPRRPPGGSTA